MKYLIFMLFAFLLVNQSQASQCRFKPDKETFNEANYVFLAEVKSAEPKKLLLSVTKVYKGNSEKVKSIVPSSVMENKLEDLEALKVGSVYFFSSSGSLDSNTGQLTIKQCDPVFLPNPVKNRFSWLDKVNLPDITKESDKKSEAKDPKKK